MTKQQAISHFKGVALLSRALGVTSSAVSQWRGIPWDRQMQLQTITRGKLKADPNPHLWMNRK